MLSSTFIAARVVKVNSIPPKMLGVKSKIGKNFAKKEGIAKKKSSEKVKGAKAEMKVLREKTSSAVKSSKTKEHKKKNTTSKTKIQDLESIKDVDPEIYDFLKKNNKKLLDFNFMDTDDEDDDEEIDDIEENASEQNDAEDAGDSEDDEKKYHKPSDDLAVASDESDFEGEDDEDDTAGGGQKKITLNMLRQWEVQLRKPNVPVEVVRQVIQAFNSALASISADSEGEKANSTTYKVVGQSIFNGVIQLCLLYLQPAIIQVLGVKPNSSLPLHKHKKWVKVRGCLRYYLTDLIHLIEQMSGSSVLNVLLKHLHQMAGMVTPFTTLGKTILKRLIVLWSTGEESVPVLAMMCIVKITRKQQATMLNHVLKSMFMSYVRNSKFVSPNTLPSINFMRLCLVEMFALDLKTSYHHAFLFIRLLAIQLRNAVVVKKKDAIQTVYNWQYINSLRLWSDVLGAISDNSQLQQLIYPLITIIIGVIRLIPSAQYFPLRFHCLKSLISLAKATHTYVPVLPLIVEVLRSETFTRKHSSVSMKPLQFTCILRLNKAQLAENGFRDEVVEQVCGLLLEYLSHESASLAFSDLVVPVVMALKAYLKKCRNANYARKLKQVMEKIQESSRFIEQQRSKSSVNFDLKDMQAVQAWEQQLRNKRTPLDIYYASWLKTHETKKRRQAAQTDDINADYDVPKVNKRSAKTSVPVRNEDGEIELFPSDSEDEDVDIQNEDDDEDNSDVEPPQPKKTKKEEEKKTSSKKSKEKPSEEDAADDYDDSGAAVDIVKDLDLNDW